MFGDLKWRYMRNVSTGILFPQEQLLTIGNLVSSLLRSAHVIESDFMLCSIV